MDKNTIQINVISPWAVKNGLMVAPVIIMVEGVHHGSAGAIYWAAHILEQNAGKWEGIPVVINHPMVNGRPVSVNFNDETKNQIIGHVTNPSYDLAKKGIKAEIHVMMNKGINLSVLQKTKEISAGIFSDEVYKAGHWNGEFYNACSITMEPDHLALLPENTGACSWQDGCGIRNNIKGGSTMSIEEILLPPGVQADSEETEEERLQKLQDEADKAGVLLSTQFNRCTKTTRPAEDDEILMPVGY